MKMGIKTAGYWVAMVIVAAAWTGCKKEAASGGVSYRDVNQWIYAQMTQEYFWSDRSDWPTENMLDFTQDFNSFFRGMLQRPPTGTLPESDPHDGGYNSVGQWVPYSRIVEADAARSVSGPNSFGFQFQLMSFTGSSNVYAYVLYVVSDSPAGRAGIVRGDWIDKVNGTVMTTGNYLNYYPKLIGSSSNREVAIGRVDFTYETVTSQGIGLKPTERSGTVSLTAGPVDDNPVFFWTVYAPGGSSERVAYLMYNGFQNGRKEGTYEDDYDDDTYANSLKEAFRHFREQNATQLILDLRYNPGGYNETARLLSSLIRPAATPNAEVFSSLKIRGGVYRSGGYFMTAGETGVTALNLSQFYVLATGSTASASEMVINNLRGAARQMTVHVVGSRTEGKNVGSYEIDETIGGKTYTMWPIAFQNYNALGTSAYANGFPPGTTMTLNSNYEVDELDDDNPVVGEPFRLKDVKASPTTLNPDEPMIKKALALITGIAPAFSAGIDRSPGSRSVAGIQRLSESSLDFKPVRGSILVGAEGM